MTNHEGNPGAGANDTGVTKTTEDTSSLAPSQPESKHGNAGTHAACESSGTAAAASPPQPTGEPPTKPATAKPPCGGGSHKKSPLEPWPEPVDGGVLLQDIEAQFRRFVSMPDEDVMVVCLWALHTYLSNEFYWTPYLYVTSPVHGCGKSTLRRVLHSICWKAKSTSNTTAAAMFRRVDTDQPTFLVDEWDSMTEEARLAALSILNSGATRDGCVDQNEAREFRTFCPKAIFSIGSVVLPPPTLSRCIWIRLQKARTSESLERFKGHDGAEIQQKCLRWATDNKARIGQQKTEFPKQLNHRQQDIWEPLFAIADAIGGDYPAAVRHAAQQQCLPDEDDQSDDVQLLAAVRAAFDDANKDRLPSERLVEASQVKSHVNGPIPLARKLRLFGIRPRSIRLDDGRTPKGYLRADFEEAWSRYLPPLTPSEIRNTATSVDSEGVASPGDPQHDPQPCATVPLALPPLVACCGEAPDCCGSGNLN